MFHAIGFDTDKRRIAAKWWQAWCIFCIFYQLTGNNFDLRTCSQAVLLKKWHHGDVVTRSGL